MRAGQPLEIAAGDLREVAGLEGGDARRAGLPRQQRHFTHHAAGPHLVEHGGAAVLVHGVHHEPAAQDEVDILVWIALVEQLASLADRDMSNHAAQGLEHGRAEVRVEAEVVQQRIELGG